jgi:hypothetical protein
MLESLKYLFCTGPNGRLYDVGSILLAVEVMWVNDTMLGVSDPSQLPLRVKRILEVATKAGLGEGRTLGGVIALVRDQSTAILRQWRMQNLMDSKQPSDAVSIPPNVVIMLADQQRDCKETRLVSCISPGMISLLFLFSLFLA